MPDSSPLARQLPVTIVVLTHNRRAEVLRTLGHLFSLPARAAIVVVDNGSTDGSADAIAQGFPAAKLIRLAANAGAAGRNYGVEAVRTRYVAFCDDDTWWAPGSIERASALLDHFPKIAVLCARILVGADARLDATSEHMARSPFPPAGLPGPLLLGFMAGASMIRVDAFRQVGGYCRRLFLGGEEQLVAFDLAARGWKMAYCDELTVHHFPSAARDDRRRRMLLARNAIWIAWLRLPWRDACTVTKKTLSSDSVRDIRGSVLWRALTGMPWALVHRHVLPAEVQSLYRQLAAHEAHSPGRSFKKPPSEHRERPRSPSARPRTDEALCPLCGESLPAPGYIESVVGEWEVGAVREFGCAPCPCCGGGHRRATRV